MIPRQIGLLGCGSRINSLLAKLPGLGEQAIVSKIYDPNPEAAARLQARFNPGAEICHDYLQVVQAPEIDWVFITSWNCFHRDHAIAAAKAGKHIFCEKPLATNFNDCLAIRKAVTESGKLFVVGFTLRYSPHYMMIRELVEQGRIGRIISLEFNETLDFNHGGFIMGDWRRLIKNSGTHLLEKCCHDLDLANWIVNSQPSRTASFGGLNFFLPENRGRIEELGSGSDKSGRSGRAYMTWRPKTGLNPFTSDKDIIDNQVAIIEYENGVRATFHTNCNAAIPERRMYIVGSHGTLRTDVIAGLIQYKAIGFDREIEDLSTSGKGGHGGGDQILGDELMEAILHGKPPRTGLQDGMVAAATAFAIDKAMESGKVVEINQEWSTAEHPELFITP